MATAIRPLTTTGTEFADGAADPAFTSPAALAFAYNYDQLNRLTSTSAFSARQGASGSGRYEWASTGLFVNGHYRQTFAYDPNGNILTQTRKDGQALTPATLDNLTYHYNLDIDGDLINNQLNHVDDANGQVLAGTNAAGRDMPDQSSDNYTYDEIGNLISEASEGSTIAWNVYRKVKTVTRTANKLIFDYDGAGKRISKTNITNIQTYPIGSLTPTYADTLRTHYIYDAGGNVLATYKRKTVHTIDENTISITDSLWLNEQHLYGSSRLGIYVVDSLLSVRTATQVYSGSPLAPEAFVQNNPTEQVYTGNNVYTLRGRMRYELSNHLGNVLVTISDKKLKHATEDHYYPDVITFTDYYAFGMAMPNRTGYIGLDGSGDPEAKFLTGGENQRYAFNGKEADRSEWNTGTLYDYGFRIYDPRLGKFLSVDPLCGSYPWFSPYQFAGNMPTWAVDIDGLEPDKSPNNNEGVILDAPDKGTGNNETWQSDGKTWNKCEGVVVTPQTIEQKRWQRFNEVYKAAYRDALQVEKDKYDKNGYTKKLGFRGNYPTRVYDEANKRAKKWALMSVRPGGGVYGSPEFTMEDEYGNKYVYPSVTEPGLEDANWIIDIPLGFGINKIMAIRGAASSAMLTDDALRVIVGNGGSNVREMSIVREVCKGEKIDDLINYCTLKTQIEQVEYAVVTLGPKSVAPGTRVIVSGGRDGISFQAGHVSRIFGHTHPYATGPSKADYEAL